MENKNTDTLANLNRLEIAYHEAVQAERRFVPSGTRADSAALLELWRATDAAFNAYQKAIREAMGG